jgi:hypothetical protein
VRAGDPIDLYSSNWLVPSGEATLGIRHLSVGRHLLTVEVTGKNAAPENTTVGLDYLRLIPARKDAGTGGK